MSHENGRLVSCGVCRRNLAEPWVRAIQGGAQGCRTFSSVPRSRERRRAALQILMQQHPVGLVLQSAENALDGDARNEPEPPSEASGPAAPESGDAMDL